MSTEFLPFCQRRANNEDLAGETTSPLQKVPLTNLCFSLTESSKVYVLIEAFPTKIFTILQIIQFNMKTLILVDSIRTPPHK